MHWFNDVDLNLRIKASVGALLQLALTGGLLALWLGGEKAIKVLFSDSLTNGVREYGGFYWQKLNGNTHCFSDRFYFTLANCPYFVVGCGLLALSRCTPRAIYTTAF